MPKSILIYDGDCGFCKRWIKRWQKITGDAIDYAPYQAVHAQYPQIPITQFQKAVQFVESSGQFYSGAYAVAKSLAANPRYRVFLILYEKSKLLSWVAEKAYGVVARNRLFFSKLTRHF